MIKLSVPKYHFVQTLTKSFTQLFDIQAIWVAETTSNKEYHFINDLRCHMDVPIWQKFPAKSDCLIDWIVRTPLNSFLNEQLNANPHQIMSVSISEILANPDLILNNDKNVYIFNWWESISEINLQQWQDFIQLIKQLEANAISDIQKAQLQYFKQYCDDGSVIKPKYVREFCLDSHQVLEERHSIQELFPIKAYVYDDYLIVKPRIELYNEMRGLSPDDERQTNKENKSFATAKNDNSIYLCKIIGYKQTKDALVDFFTALQSHLIKDNNDVLSFELVNDIDLMIKINCHSPFDVDIWQTAIFTSYNQIWQKYDFYTSYCIYWNIKQLFSFQKQKEKPHYSFFQNERLFAYMEQMLIVTLLHNIVQQVAINSHLLQDKDYEILFTLYEHHLQKRNQNMYMLNAELHAKLLQQWLNFWNTNLPSIVRISQVSQTYNGNKSQHHYTNLLSIIIGQTMHTIYSMEDNLLGLQQPNDHTINSSNSLFVIQSNSPAEQFMQFATKTNLAIIKHHNHNQKQPDIVNTII